MSYKIQTIDELERFAYGRPRSEIAKALDAGGLTTTTSGTENFIYGAYAWVQVNQEANGFGIMPKMKWDRSGWRMVLDRATLTAKANQYTSKGGTVEGGEIASPTKPTFAQENVVPKIMQIPFQTTTVREWLSKNGSDDFWGSGLEGMRLIMAVRHKELLNQTILADGEVAAAAATGDRAGVYDWESYDVIVSNYAEQNGLSASGQDKWYNPWLSGVITRDTDTDAYNCTVDSASGTIGTDGNLTDDVIRGFQNNIREKSGKESTVYLGGYDIYNEIQGIYSSQVRYNVLGENTVQVGVNGIQTFNGIGVGIHVGTVYGIPYIPTKDAPKGAGTEVGRMFAFDTSDEEGYGFPRIGIQIALPTTYNEIGRGMQGWPWVTDGFVEDALYWTMGETICRSFKAQGKLRDVKV